MTFEGKTALVAWGSVVKAELAKELIEVSKG
jgi:hypothetical protein